MSANFLETGAVQPASVPFPSPSNAGQSLLNYDSDTSMNMPLASYETHSSFGDATTLLFDGYYNDHMTHGIPTPLSTPDFLPLPMSNSSVSLAEFGTFS
jgi:hypothetical protein